MILITGWLRKLSFNDTVLLS